MAEWEAALDKFLVPWRRRRDVTGALVCGSFLSGYATPHSDIDVHILLKPGTKWRERGNDVIDKFLVEYFANPPAQVRRYFAEDFAASGHMCATQFATGRIVFDRTGVIGKLQAEAGRWIRKPFKRPGRVETLRAKYGLWDQLDTFQDSVERRLPDVPFQYAHCVYWVVRLYARHRGDCVQGASKIYRAMTSDEMTCRYLHRPLSDPRFGRMVGEAMMMTKPAAMRKHLEGLTRYVLDRMGGFDIDGFRLRSPAVRK